MGRRISCRRPVSLAVTRLEDRTVPASDITVIVGAKGSGSLDNFLFDATPGTIVAADGGTVPGTLSTGALTAVSPTIDINVRAQGNLTFNDLGGTLTLPTGPGHTASFSANPGSLSVANAGNTLATSGGSLFLSALGNLAVFNVNSAGGNVGLSISTTANTLTARSIQAGAGSVNVSTSASTSATISQSGTVVGGDILFIGGGAVSVDDLRGSNVNLQSTNGSVSSAGANLIQSTGQLILVAGAGITVNTLVASIAAANHVSGNISITQAASPARPLATLPLIGIANQAPGGSITVTNLGDAISVVSGATIVSNNGPIALVAQDFNIGAAVNSGTARTTLANSTAGRQFDLGTNTAGNIGLTQAELNSVTAGVLQIGSATAGPIVISAAVGPFAGTNTLALVNNSTITEGAAISLAVPNLRLSSLLPGLAGPNNVGTLAGVAPFRVIFDCNSPLIVGTVDGVSGISGTGVFLFADSLDVQQPINAGTDVLRIVPFTSGRQVSLGSEVSGQLSLTDAELGRMTAAVVHVGSATATPGISVNAAVTRHAGYGTLSLFSAGSVGQTAPVSVASLAIRSGDNVGLSNAGNDVDTVAAQVTGLGHTFTFTDTNAVAIGVVDSVTGISTTTGLVQVSAGGAITDGNGSAVNVIGNLLIASAGGGVDLDVGVALLGVTGIGPMFLTAAGSTTISGLSAPGGSITLDGGSFSLGGNNAIAAGSSLVIAGATLNLQAFNESVAVLQLASGSIIGAGTLTSTAGFDVRSGSISAPLGSTAGLFKSTAGTVILSGVETYSGATTVGTGTLLINGSLAAGSSMTLNGGTLGGSGTVGSVTASIGTVSPGNSPGLLTANGNVSFGSNSAFVAEVNGATAGTQYDQLKVNGTVSLGGAPLNLLIGGGFVPAVGAQFVLIDNDGVDAVNGTFNGLPPGATLLVAGQRFTISYTGGTGNDVVLTKAPVAVQSVIVDDGTAQRSMVRSVTVTFEGQAAFVGTAFQLNRTGSGGPTGPVTLAVDTSGSSANQTVARLTFLGPLTEGANSLIDGNYTLTVLSGQVQGGIQGGDNLSSLHRLYGDVNGDKAVNGLDLTAFRGAFGTIATDANYASFLDFNGDGAINGTDLTQFRNRFGVILP